MCLGEACLRLWQAYKQVYDDHKITAQHLKVPRGSIVAEKELVLSEVTRTPSKFRAFGTTADTENDVGSADER
jgi:hypothetical protein